MRPLPGTQTRTDGGSLRRHGLRSSPGTQRARGGGAGGQPEPAAAPASRHPRPVPSGEEQLTGTCDFFSPMDPNPPQLGAGWGWGRGTGGEEKNFSWRMGGGLKCSPQAGTALLLVKRPRPLARQGPFAPPRAPQTRAPGRSPGPRGGKEEACRREAGRQGCARRPCLLDARRPRWRIRGSGPRGGCGPAPGRAAGGRSGRREPHLRWRGADLTLCCPSRGGGAE
jgi:hypothetical protein